MKQFLTLALTLTFAICLSAKDKKQEATVTFSKTEKGVDYRIDLIPSFKINKDAPFKFELKKGDGSILKKVALKEFSNKEKSFSYKSELGEKKLKYWFIACRYKGKEVVACKTFTGSKEIK
jgi:hypothetical protein